MAPLAAAGVSPAAARDCHKPNIVLVMTDQQTALAMSCAGNPYLDTPNMDRLSAMGIRFENNYCTGPQLNVPQWSGFEMIHPCDDKGLGESAAAWLSQKKNGPFMLVASFENPHNICEWARSQNLPYGNVALPSPEDCPPLPGNFERNSDDADVLLYEQGANYSAYPTVRFTDQDWRNYRYVYYRLVEKVDAEIGKIIKSLDDNALWEDSLVIFTSDHGDGVGAHHWNQKSALYEEVVNVPLIVVLPGQKHAGQTRVQLVGGGVDLFATICDWAGIAERRDGVSFRKVAEKNAPGHTSMSFMTRESVGNSCSIWGRIVWNVRIWFRIRIRNQSFCTCAACFAAGSKSMAYVGAVRRYPIFPSKLLLFQVFGRRAAYKLAEGGREI